MHMSTCRQPRTALPGPHGALRAVLTGFAGLTVSAGFAVFTGVALFSGGALHAESDLTPPSREYYAYVCAESEDEVSLVRFGPSGIEVTKTITVGSFPAETEGPHGIGISPGGQHWYVSISHGNPFGSIHKYETGTDEWLGDVRVGMFPATLDVAATTGLLFVVNSDFYGDHVPSTISVVETSTMTEIAQFVSGTMPHGARFSGDGRKLYSVNMMDDELVEVDALRFEVSRRLKLAPTVLWAHGESRREDHGEDHAEGHGESHGEDRDDQAEASAPNPGRASATGPDADATTVAALFEHHVAKLVEIVPDLHRHGAHEPPSVEPSWVTPPTSDGLLYITALSGNAIYEVDTNAWKVSRRLETPAAGPYNAAVAPDERLLVVTYKKGDAIGFWDLEKGREVAQAATTRRIPHGVVITSDGRFSLVTVEGIGGEPGAVEVYDNAAFQRVARIDIGKQAGGIALWEPN